MDDKILYLDGAMGTMLQKNGLLPGHNPELLCLTDPDQITAIHAAYVQAGADVVYANTFSANRYKLPDDQPVELVIQAAIACAKRRQQVRAFALRWTLVRLDNCSNLTARSNLRMPMQCSSK